MKANINNRTNNEINTNEEFELIEEVTNEVFYANKNNENEKESITMKKNELTNKFAEYRNNRKVKKEENARAERERKNREACEKYYGTKDYEELTNEERREAVMAQDRVRKDKNDADAKIACEAIATAGVIITVAGVAYYEANGHVLTGKSTTFIPKIK